MWISGDDDHSKDQTNENTASEGFKVKQEKKTKYPSSIEFML
jgi:hypothetical protein